MDKLKISGGPDRKAFGKNNIIPMNMSDDSFWDTPAHLNTIDEDCKSGKIIDLIIVSRYKGSLVIHWRGNSPMTTALGMLEWAKTQVIED